jgi:hypothetical protein
MKSLREIERFTSVSLNSPISYLISFSLDFPSIVSSIIAGVQLNLVSLNVCLLRLHHQVI